MPAPIVPPTVAPTPEAPVLQMSPRAQAMQERILELQLKQLEKSEQETEETERITREGRKQGAIEMQKKRNRELQSQEACPHVKPNMQTAICGQRTHGPTTTLLCQYCQAEFTEKTIPRHLIPAEHTIGGPNPGGIL